MKRSFLVIFGVVLLIVLASCATSADFKKGEPIAPSRPVVLGLDGIPQPDWIYQSVISQDHHFESGYGKMSDRQNSIKRATVEAKNKIAQWVSTNVKEVLVTYVSDMGSGDDRQALDAMESISLQVAEATLVGVTTDNMWIDAEGGVWVLCSIPLANVEKNFEPAAEAVAESFARNEAADVAEAKMKEAYARLLAQP